MNLAEELLQAREKLVGMHLPGYESLLFRAASEIEQLQKDNVDARSKCICVFCKAEFSKTDLSGAVEHLCSCDKSPLVQRGRELFAQVEELQALLEAWKNEDPRMLLRIQKQLAEKRES